MRRLINFIIAFLLLFIPAISTGNIIDTIRINDGDAEIIFPEIVIQNIESNIIIRLTDEDIIRVLERQYYKIELNGEKRDVFFRKAIAKVPYTVTGKEQINIRVDNISREKNFSPIPIWMSILPPLIAILFALVFREVFSALFIGLLVGTTIISYYKGSTFFIAIFQGLFLMVDTYILESMTDPAHLSIIVFSLLIGATVNLITRNGGMKGVVNILSRYAKSSSSGQFVTWLLGVMIFFDDYANTLVVGNTMRPLTDKLRISREKLAYIVDSTAAPIAAVAFVTTWIGAELSYIQNGIDRLGIEEGAYSVFLNSLGYSFYPILTLIFIIFLILRKSDYGPMIKAERLARSGKAMEINKDKHNISDNSEGMESPENIKGRWYNAVIPVLIIILGTLSGLMYTGWDQNVWDTAGITFSKKLSMTIGNSDPYKSLLWSSLSGVVAAVLLTMSQRILKLRECVDSLISGFKTMLTAIVILVLAWSIALITDHMHTADFISMSMLKISISPYLVPALTFILAALVSFSTGSSWGTMAILYPLLMPASWLISMDYGLNEETSLALFYNVVSCVLAGSVLGDHCSPISDTTILSSLASSCNHIEHVRTQLPYALTVGGVAVLAGTIPSAYGVSAFITYPIAIILLFSVILILGRKIPYYKHSLNTRTE